MRKVIGIGFVTFSLTGCMALQDMEDARSRRAQAEHEKAIPPRPKPSSQDGEKPAAESVDPKLEADVRTRTDALEARVMKAVRLEGTADSEKALVIYRGDCAKDSSVCSAKIKTIPAENIGEGLGALAGLAVAFLGSIRKEWPQYPDGMLDDRLGVAQTLAEKCEKIAQMSIESRANQAKLDAERPSLAAAREVCLSNAAECAKKCAAKDNAFCTSQAERLQKLSKLTEAHTLAADTCRRGMYTACLLAEDLGDEVKTASAKTEGAWQGVEQVGDEIARKRFAVETFSKIARSPRQQNDLARMRIVTTAISTERFCPVKKEFIKLAGQPEFTKRAAQHCKESAPEATGLGGGQVTLTAQCNAAFAAACP